MGRIYQRQQRDGTLGGPWWLDFYNADGKRMRISSETENKREALAMLKVKEGKAASGETVIAGRATWAEVRDALLAHYESTGERNLEEVRYRLSHLDRHFGSWRAEAITSKAVADYIVRRQREET